MCPDDSVGVIAVNSKDTTLGYNDLYFQIILLITTTKPWKVIPITILFYNKIQNLNVLNFFISLI